MITSRREQSLDLTILTGTGTIQTGEVMSAMEELYAGTPTRYVLWDFSGADITPIDFEGVQAITRLTVKYGQNRPGGKTAIVSTQQVAFGITRVYESLVDGGVAPLQVRVCRTLAAALQFLGIESLPGERS